MRWASYCCLLPVPRASNSHRRLAVFADDLCTKTVAKERKQTAKQRESAGPQSKGAEEETEPLSRLAEMGEREGMEASHLDGVRRRHRALPGGPGTHAPLHGVSSAPVSGPQLSQPTPLTHYLLFLPYAPCFTLLLGKPSFSPGACRGPVSRVVSLGALLAAFATCRWRCWWGEQVRQLPFYKVCGIILALNQCRWSAPPSVPF